ncbi:MAG: allantoinase AllB [Enterobacteriaceae bacterium]
MNYDLVIKNGMVILENEARVTDVAISKGKIVAIGDDLPAGAQVTDASGLIVSPGMIDAHMHISEPGRTEWEGYDTATRAAAKGGVTCCIEMPLNQMPATIDRKTLQVKLAAGKGKLSVDVASFGGLVPHNLDRLHELSEEGVVAYKCFLVPCGSDREDDFCHVDDYALYAGMQQLQKLGKRLAIHAENPQICSELGRQARMAGKTRAKDYVDSRPVFSEVEAVRRVLYFASVTGCKVHICHISCPEAVAEVTRARQAGIDATCESCGHYFAIDLEQFEEMGAIAKCSPPIRDQDNQHRLWEKLFAGEIDLIASDHSPCTPDLKEGTIFTAWGGISALQNTLDVFFDEAVQKRGMSLTQFARLIATNPADIFHLHNKGRIAIGKDADIILIKPNSPYRLQAEDLEYRNKISAYVGRTIGAQVSATLLRGEWVYRLGEGIVKPYQGQFVFADE